MPMDTATREFLAAATAQDSQLALHQMTPAQAREFSSSLGALNGRGPYMFDVQDIHIPQSQVRARVFRPTETVDGIIVYYHGGGWVIGDLDGFDTLARTLAQQTGCTVVLVDYRLAPEHRFPAAVDDAWDALRWAASNLNQIAGRSVPLVVAGDSAGGNLAAVMALRAIQHGAPQIAFQLLVYPVTDCDFATASYLDPENQLLLTREGMRWFWSHYLPDEASRGHPDASPLRAASLSGAAPALVITAEFDPLRDEGEAYADRLRAEGVRVELIRFAGQMHGFFTMINVLPASEEAIGLASDRLRVELSLRNSSSDSTGPPIRRAPRAQSSS